MWTFVTRKKLNPCFFWVFWSLQKIKFTFFELFKISKTYFDFLKKLELRGPFGGLGLPRVSYDKIYHSGASLHWKQNSLDKRYTFPFQITAPLFEKNVVFCSRRPSQSFFAVIWKFNIISTMKFLWFSYSKILPLFEK